MQYVRLEGGILGRTDTMIHVRGNNLYPSAIEAVLRAVQGLSEYRVEVDRSGALAELRIAVEPAADADAAAVAERAGRAIRDELLVRPVITIVPPGTLPRFEMKA